MRIITGKLRGRKLKSPKNFDIRPTSDRVKEAVFSILDPFMSENAVLVDLFCGTGNLGLEAISRGAKTVYFSDSSRESIALAKENIITCGVSDQAVILAGDFKQNINRIGEKVDIVLLDPPYSSGFLLQSLQAIDEFNILKDDGIVLCEHSSKENLPENIGSLHFFKTRRYGSMSVTLYQKMKEEKAVLACEMSGHIFFADKYFGYDDAIYSTLRVLEIIDNYKESKGNSFKIDQLLENLPELVSTPEIRTNSTDDNKFKIIDKIANEINNYREKLEIKDIVTIDGLRIIFEDGFALVRAS
ncbi:MAG: 16S rRNA (guanine(966)-N(2))-methyltransferase RsmD, partial [Candidatus Moranbacteria bacterium]|nr:16S rRNA (guanine(966)-N(2))-methyltransferase RsmD [Candidatus Moranbacteria bacterium]